MQGDIIICSLQYSLLSFLVFVLALHTPLPQWSYSCEMMKKIFQAKGM